MLVTREVDDATAVPTQQRQKRRKVSIDVCRIIAAIWVVCSHWSTSTAFMLHMKHPYPVDGIHGRVKTVMSIGAVGVDIFFIISGLVIGQSAIGRDWKQFGKARLLRIYPAYFLVTLAAIFLLPHTSTEVIPLSKTWPSIFFVQWFVGYPTLIGPAWTLFYEIRFYILVAFLIFIFGKINENILKKFACGWLVVVTLAPNLHLPWLDFLSVYEYAPYFILGILLGCCHTSNDIRRLLVPLTLAFLLTLLRMALRLSDIEHSSNPTFNVSDNQILLISLLVLTITVGTCIWAMMPSEKVSNQHWASWIAKFGAMTYPIYLIHETIGMTVIGQFVHRGFGVGLSIAVSAIAVLSASWIIILYVDPMAKRLTATLFSEGGSRTGI